MRDDREWLKDILDAIERIDADTVQGKSAFESDRLIQTSVVYHLQIIGEAARQLSAETRFANPGVPWSRIIGMRNIIVHQYFGVDLDVVWDVVEAELPSLAHQVGGILNRVAEP